MKGSSETLVKDPSTNASELRSSLLGDFPMNTERSPENPQIPVKPKRKYTRKNPSVDIPVKPKRKYTRKMVPLTHASELRPSKNIYPGKDIKLSPQNPIMMLQTATTPTQLNGSLEKMPFKSQKRLNETFIALMQDLAFIMRKEKDVMRAKAYDNARETISLMTEDITRPEQLKDKPGIGKTIYQKLQDFVETGTLNILENNKDILAKKRAIDVFLNVYGIGEKKAEELVDQSIFTIEQLRQRQDEVLNDKQKIGLKYYEDILLRIPRTEIEQYEQVFLKLAQPMPQLKLQIVGSYRRGLTSSGDIDVILTSTQPSDFVQLIDYLIQHRIIVEVLSRGPSKCLVVAQLPNFPARRVDFLYTSPKEFPFSILYFTGSKGFNTTMREHALKSGYSLNEHRLSVMKDRKKGDLVDHDFPTEASIFDFLKLTYIEPHNRISGSAVVPLNTGLTETKPHVAARKTLKKKVKHSPEAITEGNLLTSKEKDETTKTRMEQFKERGISVLESLNEGELTRMVEYANLVFHQKGEPVMTDGEYDILRDFIEKKFPKNVAVQEVGADVEKNKAVLPYEMASMDKIKPDSGALQKWVQLYRGPYVISAKLDGVSGLYTTEQGEPKLYTRGDGKIGQDVSYLIPHLKLPPEHGWVIRGEFIIKRDIFEQKYKSRFSNSRNLVAGIVNAKSLDSKIRDVDFVAYEVIRPENLHPSKQMEKLLNLNVNVVKHRVLCELSNEKLSEILQEWRAVLPENHYEIDGIIVSNDNVYPRKSGNPDHSFAFKMVISDQIAETHVVDVEWNVSKDGYLKPRVRVNEVELGGVKINYVTGINGAFIEKNKIGIGAIVKIIRSGDVIPKIESVTTPAEHPKMPAIPYRWNATHIDIMLMAEAEEGNLSMREKQIGQFFRGIEVDGLGPGNVVKIVKAGNDTICKILAMKEADFMNVEGFQKKTAEKLYQGIQTKIQQASLATIMSASNQFGRGFGKERIELILKEYPQVLDPREQSVEKLKQVKGIAEKTAKEFVENIPRFVDFLKNCGLEQKMIQFLSNISRLRPSMSEDSVPLSIRRNTSNVTSATGEPTESLDQTHPLYGKTVVMTGFREKDLESNLKKVGAKLGSSVSSNTFAVVVKTADATTGKTEDAKKFGIPVYSFADFVRMYF